MAIEKLSGISPKVVTPSRRSNTLFSSSGRLLFAFAAAWGTYVYLWPSLSQSNIPSIYGSFPRPDDPFRFLPCTKQTVPPPIDDPHHETTWSNLFDPNPNNWNWGEDSIKAPGGGPREYRGIYLCGYLDVPLDYLNKSDTRIVRQAVTKYQVSGLKRRDGRSPFGAGLKAERTLFIEPGGPGGSGTSYAWRAAEQLTHRFSDNQYDVLGWDPRGVNISQPTIACFPFDVDRDHWSLLTSRYPTESTNPRQQLQVADAMNDAIFRACYEKHGDLLRFMSTASVARDLEELRKAAGEDEVTGYLVSYGTGLGQTYVNMFPDRSGRIILDGTEYARDNRMLGGFGFSSLDNITDAWHDGFLGECVKAGPEHCELARPLADGKSITLNGLQKRLESFITSIIENPIPAYTERTGPSLITYTGLVNMIYRTLYQSKSWPAGAKMLAELEQGNATLAARMLESLSWEYDPTLPSTPGKKPSSRELTVNVICADSFDAPLPEEGLDWWEDLWKNMTEQSWIGGNSNFLNVLPCRHFTKYWPNVSEVYRGDLDNKLKNPVLLIAEPYDPATPLRNGRRLLEEMGDNARLIAHHGYGHSSADASNCTDAIVKKFILEGIIPDEKETACYANQKPYDVKLEGDAIAIFNEELRRPW